MMNGNLRKSRLPFTLFIFLCCLIVLGQSVGLAAPLARLESPAQDAFFRSGVGLIRGWSCEAGRVEVSIDGGPLMTTAYGTDRPDTATVCGRTNTGFGLIYNWNRLGEGVHNMRAFVAGVEFANVNFTVATLGKEFLIGVLGNYTIQDFPAQGASAKISWSEPHQNFVFTTPTTVPAITNPPSQPTARLESPVQGSSESGIGLIRGWVCQAGPVEISIDGGPRLATAHGTDRPDTLSTCGRTDTGFGLTYNWNRAGDGIHNVRAFADGVEFANVNFSITTLGQQFITDLLSKIRLRDFPGREAANPQIAADDESATTLQWSEADQNFIITNSTVTDAKIATVAAVTDILNKLAVLGVGSKSLEALGLQARKNALGQPTDIDGLTWIDDNAQAWADLRLGDDKLPRSYKDSTGVEARLDQFTSNSVAIQFIDGAGQARGAPITVPIKGNFLQLLQQRINELKQPADASATDSSLELHGGASGTDRNPAASSNAFQFSLNALLVKLFGSGSVAAGEVLCALRTAASNAGLPNPVAATSCQSPLISDFLALANTANPQAMATNDLLDSKFQQSLQFVQNVTDAPCAQPGDSVSCLIAASADLRVIAAPGRPISPDPPSSTVPAPDVVGQTQSAAANALNAAGLTVGSVTQQANATVPAGTVISQNPAAGVPVPSGSAVNLVVSSGPGSITVPDLVGRTESAARQALQIAALTVGTVTQEASSTVPAGTVIRQNPPAGVLVTSGSQVNLVVSSGPAPVNVPNVVGLSQSAAAIALQRAGLTLGTVTQETSATAPAGTVIRQNPAAGTAVLSGSAVGLVLSSGPPLVSVPNVVGQSQREAAATLAAVKLTVGQVIQQSSATVPAGIVISQRPTAGAAVPSGSAVDLVVSSGPEQVIVPNVVGLAEQTAGGVLRRAGLTVGRVTYRYVSSSIPDRTVTSQNPTAGTSVAAGSAIDLVVHLFSLG